MNINTDYGFGETKEVDLEKDTDGGSDETKEVDLTAAVKATAETEAVHKEDSAEETDGRSGETKEVDTTANAKGTVETEAIQFSKKILQRKQQQRWWCW